MSRDFGFFFPESSFGTDPETTKEYLTRQSAKSNAHFLQAASVKTTSKPQKHAVVSKPPRKDRKHRRKGQSQSQREGKRKHRSGGGGAQRAFVRERLRNTPAEQRTDKSAFFTRVNAEFRALSFEERKPYVALGEAATITHRAGESSFPKLPRTRTTVSSRRQQALSQSQPFLQEAYALTARAHAEAAAASARRKTQQQERESAHLQRLTALNADFPDPVPTELDASFLVLRSQARCAASVDSRV